MCVGLLLLLVLLPLPPLLGGSVLEGFAVFRSAPLPADALLPVSSSSPASFVLVALSGSNVILPTESAAGSLARVRPWD